MIARQVKKLNESNHPLVQVVKYGMVGVLNTLVTLVVIFLCKSVMGINEYLSNFIGYACGILNSFIFNRIWVFHSRARLQSSLPRFLLGCGICYLLQFVVLWTLTSAFGDVEYDLGFFVLSGYGVATLIAMVVYTAANFLYNKLVAFRH